MQGIGILIIVFFTLVQFVCSPFWDRRVNRLDCICCLSILLHLISFIYYNDANFILQPGAAAFDSILVVVNVFVIAAILGLFVVCAAEALFRRRATDEVARVVSKHLLTLQADLRRNRETFARLLNTKLATAGHNGSLVESRLSKSDFEHCVKETLQEAGLTVSPQLMEALFVVLKRIGKDDHEAVTATEKGLQVEMVILSVPICATPPAASHARVGHGGAVTAHPALHLSWLVPFAFRHLSFSD